jgi:hypothetical protein
MATKEATETEPSFEELLRSAAPDKEGTYRTKDGRVFETTLYYPDPLTVEEFIAEIMDSRANHAFINNMNDLREEDPVKFAEKSHVEDWIQLYAAWREMND